MGAAGRKQAKFEVDSLDEGKTLETLVLPKVERTSDFDPPREDTDFEILRRNLRVLFIHGGGSRQGQVLTDRPVPNYLRDNFTNFHAEHVTDTSQFENAIQVQAKAIRTFCPDIVITKSQGGPVIKSIIDKGYWKGPTLSLVPAFVPGIDKVAYPKEMAVLFVFGTQDNQVPLSTRDFVVEHNSPLVEEQMKIYTIEDTHAMSSILESASKPNMDQLIGELWIMSLRNKAYKHEDRLPAVSDSQLSWIGLKK
jgi:hypothetical protein